MRAAVLASTAPVPRGINQPHNQPGYNRLINHTPGQSTTPRFESTNQTAMLTSKQICETLEISSTTLRRWADQYLTLENHEPGKHRTYTPEDLTTLQNVKTLLANGLTYAAIKSRLNVVEQNKPPAEANPSTALLSLPEFQTAMENARATISSMQNEIEELKNWKTEFQQWATLPTWKRIFTTPPTGPKRPQNPEE